MQITKEELLKELLKFRSSGKLILYPEDIPAKIRLLPQWEPAFSKPFGSFKVMNWYVYTSQNGRDIDSWIAKRKLYILNPSPQCEGGIKST